MTGKPSYYSILPANVRYDNRLSDSEKLLFTEITALTQKNGECWASNDYFANLYDVSLVTISRRISKLKKYGFIEVRMIYREGTKEILRRIIKIDNTYNQNCSEGIIKNDNTPIIKIDKDSITSKSNTTSINNKEYGQNELTDNEIKDIPEKIRFFQTIKINGSERVDPEDADHPFNIFWDKYPKRVKKKDAEIKFKRNVKDAETLRSIWTDISNRLSSGNWDDSILGIQYIPDPSTYLHNHMWEDEIKVMTGFRNNK